MYSLKAVDVRRGDRTILSIDSLQIPDDELLVVLGHNGSGKSTLLSLLAGQERIDSGGLTLDGRPMTRFGVRELARRVAFLPQRLPESAGLTVRDLVGLGRFAWRGTFGLWRDEDHVSVEQAMQKTGVDAYADRLADALSGGERQRAWVAMLLAQQAPLLLLDEPTSALDIQHQHQLLSLLAELQRDSGVGVIVVLHDLNLAIRYATHIIALQAGRVAHAGTTESLLDEERLSSLYNAPIRLIDHPMENSNMNSEKVAVVCL